MLVDTSAFPSCTSLLMIGAGSRYENMKNNGIAHFFEHMAFKGSKKYPNALVLSSIIEGLGGEFNAFTSKDYTGYYVKSPVQYVETVLDVLSDMIISPKLSTKEIEKEKGVIVQEINMYEDTPRRIVFNLYENLLYKKSSLGMNITGSAQTVTNFNRRTFTDYMQQLYAPNNAVLVISGGLSYLNKTHDSEYYTEMVEKKFELWSMRKTADFEPIVEESFQKGLLVRSKKSEQAHLCFGYRAFSEKDDDKYALSVLAAVLGMGMSSRLFTEVREKRGLCYAISTFVEHYHDVGHMVTYAGVPTDVNKVVEAVDVIKREHEKLLKINIKHDELKRAQELIKGRLVLSLEDTFNVAYLYGKELLHLHTHTPVKKILEHIDRVTVEDVKRVARRVISEQASNLALVGPFNSKDQKLKF